MNAKDLLNKFIELQCDWSNQFSNTKSARIRKEQIEALLKAFDITKRKISTFNEIKYFFGNRSEGISREKYLSGFSDFQYFQYEEFLNDREKEEYFELANLAKSKLKDLFPNIPQTYFEKEVNIKWMYNDLLRYRMEIHKSSREPEGMQEGFSVGLIYSHYLRTELNKKINENLSAIDETLSIIIDPKKRSFDMEYLIKEFNYPDVDLVDIECETRSENL